MYSTIINKKHGSALLGGGGFLNLHWQHERNLCRCWFSMSSFFIFDGFMQSMEDFFLSNPVIYMARGQQLALEVYYWRGENERKREKSNRLIWKSEQKNTPLTFSTLSTVN
jgi:hypothetical protein